MANPLVPAHEVSLLRSHYYEFCHRGVWISQEQWLKLPYAVGLECSARALTLTEAERTQLDEIRSRRHADWLREAEPKIRQYDESPGMQAAIAAHAKMPDIATHLRHLQGMATPITEELKTVPQSEKPEPEVPNGDGADVGEAWPPEPGPTTFTDELTGLLNRFGGEAPSNTPDFILAQFVNLSLAAFAHAMEARDRWYRREAPPTEFEKAFRMMEFVGPTTVTYRVGDVPGPNPCPTKIEPAPPNQMEIRRKVDEWVTDRAGRKAEQVMIGNPNGHHPAVILTYPDPAYPKGSRVMYFDALDWDSAYAQAAAWILEEE